MLTFLLGAFGLYIVVRLAASHGANDAEESRPSRERHEAFERMIESGELAQPDDQGPARRLLERTPTACTQPASS